MNKFRKIISVCGIGTVLIFAILYLTMDGKSSEMLYSLIRETEDDLDANGFLAEFHVARNETRLIVAWTEFFGNSMEDMAKWATPYCPAKCIYSSKTALVSSADAVLFHIRDTNANFLPRVRHSFQKYVFLTAESPIHSGSLQGFPNNFFNLTMTYRSDSDIRTNYDQFVPNKAINVSRSFYSWTHVLNVVSMKTKMVVQLVSHCDTSSKRERYVEELSKSISVDIFGVCSKISCGTKEDCDLLVTDEYRFYLSFENSICLDYVTEKFWRLKMLIVPIVLRGADYEKIAPKSSYIAADQFDSPKELAAYLTYLANNRTEYLKYFEWTKHYPYTAEPGMAFCDLCQMLYDSNLSKAYDDIEKWWTERSYCQNDYALSLL